MGPRFTQAAAVVRPISSRWIRSRLLHFAVLGGAIFALAPRDAGPARIEITRADLDALRAGQAAKTGVAELSPDARFEVDARLVQDEVLYREALRLGLDRDDALIRQHLVQKTLSLAEDLDGAARAPTDAELRAYYDRTRAQWTTAERVHLVHVFAATREGAIAAAPAARSYAGAGAPPAGDAFPLPREITVDRAAIAAQFGPEFEAAVKALPVGVWSEPIASKLGFHLVEIQSIEPEREPPFADIAPRLAFELQVERRHGAVDSFIRRAFARYDVEIAGRKLREPPASKRLALRTEPSAED